MTELSAVRHEFAPPLIPGRLIRRRQRFLADVELEDGRVVEAHCPNSGSMLGCMEPGAPVRLSPAPDPKRRTAYTWEMTRMGPGWVGINTMLPNRLVIAAARLRAHPLFAQAQEVRGEVKVSSASRIDLMATTPQGPLYVEVKNVTLARGDQARFPDARTTRGAKHLRELMALKAQGAGAAMVYLVQRQEPRNFAPADDIDPDYARLFHQARQAGVQVVVLQALVSPREIRLQRELPLSA